MFCGQCGSNVDEGVKFCPNCGASMGDDISASQVQPQMNTVQSNKQPAGIKAGAIILFILHTLFYLIMTSPKEGFSGYNAYCLSLVIMGIVMIIAVALNKESFFKIAFIAGAVLGLITIIISFAVEGVDVAIEGKIVALCFVILNVLFFLKVIGIGIQKIVMIVAAVVLSVGVEFTVIDASIVIGIIFTLVCAGAYALTAFELSEHV
ncbi:MAG: zinc-ribbon domain-containing protein [Lachnospiraceae bacterium]|nr:zinc-ribbon domain-containing protein [Lachnospiraceae bacterium]